MLNCVRISLFIFLCICTGNIRVYCRIRPFLPGQAGKHTIVEYIGDDGELVVANPSKQGKEGHRMFRFNKIFGPAATQGSCISLRIFSLSIITFLLIGSENLNFQASSMAADVYSDIQPFVRSVLDGYNVCIFAYGQTGSGKTYTMVTSF